MNSNPNENQYPNINSNYQDIDNYNKTISIFNFNTEENNTSILNTINTNQNLDTLNSFNNSTLTNNKDFIKKPKYKNTEDIPILYTDPFNFSEKSKKKEIIKKNIYDKKLLLTEKSLRHKTLFSGNK
jgi:hypothetical protein